MPKLLNQSAGENTKSISWSKDLLEQWYSTWGVRTPRGARRHFKGYIKKKYIYYFMINTLINSWTNILDVIYLIYFGCRL
jgi:hypothetical protein